MEERKHKYAVGDIVRLIGNCKTLWVVDSIAIHQHKNKDGTLGKEYSYYYLVDINDYANQCQEFDGTILKKDEGANLLYEQE